MKYKIFCLIILLAAVFSFSLAFAQEEQDNAWLADVRVNPYGGEEEEAESISLFRMGETSFLFLPADTEETKIRIWHDDAFGLTVDGRTVLNGDACPELVQVGEHTLVQTGNEKTRATVQVLRSANIPAVFITTESGSLEYIHEIKGNKESGTIRVHEQGECVHELDIQSFSGRGNATWTYPKKPYNIKFKESTEFLGMRSAKKWTLLANYKDTTFLRNLSGWYLAGALGLKYTSEYRHADLYVNGEYLGNYIVCEKVEVGENRIEIRDLETENEALNGDLSLFGQAGNGKNGEVIQGDIKEARGTIKWIEMPETPDDISEGYLLEFDRGDRYNEELSGFVTDNGQSFVIKSPEHAARREAEYIAAIVNDAETALYSPSGFNEKGKHYTDYFDVDSFVSMYLIREFGNDLDAGISSIYLIKADESDRLVFSPIWDMDRAFGDHTIRYGMDYGNPAIWWANSLYYHYGDNKIPTVFNAAYRHEDFRGMVREKWERFRKDKTPEQLKTYLKEEEERLCASAVLNAIRWDIYGTKEPERIREAYAKDCLELTTFLTAREKNLDKGFSADAVMLYYEANGGNGGVFNTRILQRGEKAVVSRSIQGENEVIPPDIGQIFSCWNTRADGSGMDYKPGQEITVEEDTILYAQWKAQPVTECKVAEVTASGDVILNLTREELSAIGIEPGDQLIISAGPYSDEVPYYTGKYADDWKAMLCAIPGSQNLILCANNLDFSANSGIGKDTEVSIRLRETGGAIALQRINNLDILPNRDMYGTDAEYGNFRQVNIGRIAEGRLFRSASPIFADERGRTINRLMKEAGIRTVMNMGYTMDETSEALEQDVTGLSYYRKLYENGCVYTENMPYDYRNNLFGKELAAGFSFLAEREPPYLLHCHGGKDRTGFALMILEMLCGADEEEIIADYMETYWNLFRIREGTEEYYLIRDRNIKATMNNLITEYGKTESLQEVARNYLLDIGMDKEKLDLLINKLTGQ